MRFSHLLSISTLLTLGSGYYISPSANQAHDGSNALEHPAHGPRDLYGDDNDRSFLSSRSPHPYANPINYPTVNHPTFPFPPQHPSPLSRREYKSYKTNKDEFQVIPQHSYASTNNNPPPPPPPPLLIKLECLNTSPLKDPFYYWDFFLSDLSGHICIERGQRRTLLHGGDRFIIRNNSPETRCYNNKWLSKAIQYLWQKMQTSEKDGGCQGYGVMAYDSEHPEVSFWFYGGAASI